MSNKWVVNSEKSKADFMRHVSDMYDHHKYLTIEVKKGKPRTGSQNNALHLFLSRLSVAMNEAGLDMTTVLAHHADIPWDKEGVNAKERLWKPIQESLTGLSSTTKPKTSQYPEIYEVLNRYMASAHGISIQWPNKESAIA